MATLNKRGCTRLLVAAALLASTQVKAQEKVYYGDGRLVGMGDGGPHVFFNYYNVNSSAFRELGMTVAGGLLESIRSEEGLGGQLELSEADKDVVSKMELRSSTQRSLGMSARYQGDKYLIFLPDQSSYFIATMAQALAELSANEDLGYLNLFIMSEMDWFRGRSPRWFSASTYASYKGYPGPPTEADQMDMYTGLTAFLMMNVLFHEICHHTLGHTRTDAQEIVTLISQGKRPEAAELAIRNESEADECAARHSVRSGGVPSAGMAANLALSVVMGDAANETHPLSADRITKMKQYDKAAVNTAVERGLFPRHLADEAALAADQIVSLLEDYHVRYN